MRTARTLSLCASAGSPLINLCKNTSKLIWPSSISHKMRLLRVGPGMLESFSKRRLQEISASSVPTILSHGRLDHKRDTPYATFWIKRYWRLDSHCYCGYCGYSDRSGAGAFADLRA